MATSIHKNLAKIQRPNDMDIHLNPMVFAISAAAVGMIGGVFYYFWRNRFQGLGRNSIGRFISKKPKDLQVDEAVYWTKVEEASWESFPASDPPSW